MILNTIINKIIMLSIKIKDYYMENIEIFVKDKNIFNKI